MNGDSGLKIGDKVKFNLGLQRREGVVVAVNWTDVKENPTSVKVSFKAGDKEVVVKRKIDRDRVEVV